MLANLLAMFLRVLAPEPAASLRPAPPPTDDVFLSTTAERSPEQDLMTRTPARVQLELPSRRATGPEVFMPISDPTPAEFLGPPRVPVWLEGKPTPAGPEAFMSPRDPGIAETETFMAVESEPAIESEPFMLEAAPTGSTSVFLSTNE